MALTISDFSAFFEERYGHTPFLWQSQLLEHVVQTGRWPDRIAAPTGSGKTSAIDVHVFANALAQQDGLRLPRRMVMTVNRRSLIDDHAEHATRLQRALSGTLRGSSQEGSGSAMPTVREVAELLVARAGKDIGPASGNAIEVHTVRGGMTLDRSWNSMPTVCAVLCMTPDMWGSRALFRGYGTSRTMRSMEAGLLTRDCVLVVDEAHLNQQLLLTARRIAQLDGSAPAMLGPPVLQVVETTATPATGNDGRNEIRVDPDALGPGRAGRMLERRLMTPKAVEVKAVAISRSDEAKLADVFVDECVRLEQNGEFARAPIGCVVNTVALARTIAAKLRSRTSGGNAVVEVVGGLRQYDKAKLTSLHPSLAGGDGSDSSTDEPGVRFVVGTQALEVGIDIDLSALVTEIAPAASVVQRAGRVNRYGHGRGALILVLEPDLESKDYLGPYERDDLVAAAAWLRERQKSRLGLAPLALYEDRPPAAAPRRTLFQRLEWYDAARLSRTSEETVFSDLQLPGSGEDLTLWLRDDLTTEAEAFVVVRDHLPADPRHARQVADVVKPLDGELFSVSLRTVRRIARSLLGKAHDGGGDTRLLYYRRNKAELAGNEDDLWPGDVLVVPPDTEVLPQAKGVREDAKNLLIDGPQDVYDQVATEEQRAAAESDTYWQLRVLLRGAPRDAASGGKQRGEAQSALERARSGFLALDEPQANENGLQSDLEDLTVNALDGLARYLAASEAPSSEGAVARLRALVDDFETEGEQAEVTVVAGLGPEDDIFVMVRSRPLRCEEGRSEASKSNVFLEDHTRAVAERASSFVAALALDPSVAQQVATAAEQHDVGKGLGRFQDYLCYRWRQPRPLAKSKYRLPSTWRAQLGLVGWRHEQLSAAAYWAGVSATTEVRDLVTWLVGTSHGHGRGAFDFDSDKLLPDGEGSFGKDALAAARQLFDDGAWEGLLEALTHQYGPWGLAYLEAIVRAADQTVSGEGR